MKKVNVAVIGFGHLGRWHTQKAFNIDSCNLVAVVEPFEANQDKAKEEYPDIKVVSSLDEVIDEIDAAIVVTPTSTHFEIVKELLQNKKHVFCEKPLCSSSIEAKELSNFIQDDLVLQVGHSERCHESWEILKDTIGNINGPITVRINRVAAFKGRATDVDVVQDLMIHDLDLCHYLFGKKFKSVMGFGHKIRTNKWDHVTAIVETEDSSIFEITSGRNHVKEIRTMEIMSNSGCIYVDLFTNEIHESHKNFDEKSGFVSFKTYEKRDHLNIEQEKFYESILNNKPAVVTYNDGAFIVGLIDKVLESLEKSEKVIVD